MNTETIEQTIAKWTAEPESSRSSPTATARSEDGQALIQAGPFTWRADLPGPLGGTNQAPSPTALLLSALAACAVVFIQDTLAPQLGIRVKSVEATAKCNADARGLLGIGGAAPDLQDLSLEVAVDSPEGDGAVAELSRVWRERCPIYLALEKSMNVSTDFRSA